jgi:hypothetical protein
MPKQQVLDVFRFILNVEEEEKGPRVSFEQVRNANISLRVLEKANQAVQMDMNNNNNSIT